MNELEHGIYYALHCLEEQGEICPKDLARSMAVSPARIAALLRHMEKEGLIARLPDPSDNRQVRISATAVGIALIRQRREQLLRTLSAALAELGPEDAAAYLRLRRRLRIPSGETHIRKKAHLPPEERRHFPHDK